MIYSNQELEKLKYDTLKYFWGYDSFRNSQEDIINSIIFSKDTLALLPTGGGKSLCYQLPALVQEGTCIVISPLLALMKDQVNQLKKIGIQAEYLSSELEEDEAEMVYNSCKEGLTKLLYISPERLQNSTFLQEIEDIEISFIAVDEAHCISEWGQDFRPSYQNIKPFREQYKQLPCIALTATATPKVLEEIKQKLGLKDVQIFQQSFSRNNLSIIMEEVADKYQKIFEILKYNSSSGIIYTRTRKESEELTQFLLNNGLKNIDYFHAGLPAKEKNKKQKNWVQSPNAVLVATNAFGMGIDKDNVRFVIHYSPSASVENYYQEIGRAGRDGKPSFGYLLWNEQELENFDNILKNQIPNKKEFLNITSYLYSIFQVADGELPLDTFQLKIENIRNFTKCSFAKINNVLNFLHNQEIIFYNNLKSFSTLQLKISGEQLELLPPKDAYLTELLFRNLAGIATHKVSFKEDYLAEKIGTTTALLKDALKDLQQKNHLSYIDGALASIKFLKPRNDKFFHGKYWTLFEHIQKNKILKWEETKYLISENDFCKMKLILSYFGEKNTKNCGNCYVCKQKKGSLFGNSISDDIIKTLEQQPASLEQIAVQLTYHRKEKILENLIYLLDSGKIKMLDFRTYTLA
ncbi:MAG: ATP-dependent DNA helicase RecQ [Cruoricaptor ignavus]|nr:ATP-dependent DNA helicase RecQ [Cruoricaptor ignavus]